MYHQLKLPAQQAGSAASMGREALVKELLHYHELLLTEVHSIIHPSVLV